MELIFDERSDDTARASLPTEHGLVVARIWPDGAWSVTLWPDHGDAFSLTQSGREPSPGRAREACEEAAGELQAMAEAAGVEVELV